MTIWGVDVSVYNMFIKSIADNLEQQNGLAILGEHPSICGYCKNKLEVGFNFCPNCGRKPDINVAPSNKLALLHDAVYDALDACNLTLKSES